MAMTSVGIYEYNAKDLIGHGAFAVVYKGRLKSVSILSKTVNCMAPSILQRRFSSCNCFTLKQICKTISLFAKREGLKDYTFLKCFCRNLLLISLWFSECVSVSVLQQYIGIYFDIFQYMAI